MMMVTENRSITHKASLIIMILMTTAFIGVWLGFYNGYAFRTHEEIGGFICVIAWILLYFKFAKMYSAFKIASNSITEIGISQFLSIAFPDLILYVICCLTARGYINIVPGICTVALQTVIGSLWAVKSKQYFLKNVAPQECLLIYDKDISQEQLAHCNLFIKKLEKYYEHIFNFSKIISTSENIEDCYKEIDQYHIIIIYEVEAARRNNLIGYCVKTSKRFYITPTLEDAIGCGYQVKHFIDTPVYCYNATAKEHQTYFGKRFADIVVSLLMLIVVSPIMLATAIAVKIDDHGPVMFKQKRVGAGGRIFNVLKFRSMRVDAEADGKPRPAVENDPRITKVGRFIRKTRIDELPQLINVLKGDISLVGPRPERVEHVELYTKEIPEFTYRLRVPQGLTGYAQIYGKYNTSPKDKLLLDLLYIEQQNFLLDLKLFFLTIKIVFQPESTEGFDENIADKISNKSAD